MKKRILLLAIIAVISSCDKKNNTDTKTTKTEVIITDTIEKEPLHIVKTVFAKSGLRYRESPKGKVIGKFKYYTNVTIVEKTGITEQIKDNGKEITGEWVGVALDGKIVYVFDAFLSEPIEGVATNKIQNPIDNAIFEGYVIMPGGYHGDEIPNKITTKDWLGIFNENGTYTVEETNIKITTVYDAIVDNKGEKSGKQIVATNPKNCYLLLNNIQHLSEGTIDTIATKPFVIHPEKPYTFQFKNNTYTLSAKAKKISILSEGIFNAEDYELYFEKNENGQKTKQLLLFEPFFDDRMTTILFIGDIDGDAIPDLLIDTSNHYNSSVPTLYLSKEVEAEKLLRIVSLHTSVGC